MLHDFCDNSALFGTWGRSLSKILVLHGPNLNLLGTREPSVYSTTTLEEINATLTKEAAKQELEVVCHQTNAEHELINFVQDAPKDNYKVIIINAAGYTHTSVALRDALIAVQIPFIEVHLSNVYARETFRSKSYLSDKAAGIIIGLGPIGYTLALQAAINLLDKPTSTPVHKL